MSASAVVEEFARLSQAHTTIADLRESVAAAVGDLGFHYFAVIHHVDFAQAPPGAIRISNYPQSFYEVMAQKGYFAEDPVLAATLRTARGFLWDEVARFVPMSERQKDIVSLGTREGLGPGYTHPVHVPGEHAGSCSFAVKAGRAIVQERLPLLHFLGGFAFESGRRITRLADPSARFETLRLTDRQLECLLLTARGSSARETAETLGVAPDTVRRHLEDARARAGVRSTTQLVIRTLFEGLLTFRDVRSERRRRRP